MKIVLLAPLLLLFVNNINAYRILLVFPATSYSHYALGNRLAKGLAETGHEVTIIAPRKENNPPKHYREIYIEGLVQAAEERMKDMGFLENFSVPAHLILFLINEYGTLIVNSTLANSDVQKLLQDPNEKFDVVIVEQFVDDALKVFAHHFNCPLIAFSTAGAGHWVNGLVGNSAPRSFVTDVMLGYDGHMNFWQRLNNLFMGLIAEVNDRLFLYPKMNKLVQHYFPGAPSVQEMNSNVSLVLLNSHVSTHQPVPHVPNMIEIGGFHVYPPKPLPKDLQSYLDNAKEGVVYFSMGSNLKSKDLPQKKREAILSAFSKLKQKVLWKFEEDLPGRPDNVKIEKWLPQQDILAHPNVKVFITHGGLLSTTEAIYHGVPVLGIPIFGDQQLNMAKAVSSGFGLQISFQDITEESFGNILNDILSSNKYKENAKKRSRILHDQPMKPLDSAIYWTEYVIRHKGAYHFRSASLDLAWYQYYMFDIAVFLIAATVAATYVSCAVLKLILRKRKGGIKSKND